MERGWIWVILCLNQWVEGLEVWSVLSPRYRRRRRVRMLKVGCRSLGLSFWLKVGV
ncbi:hypothetical protein HanRHA438_Chr15g0699271 [Helianthus annuus]|nr:hypothetical protein HanRHA438_Chr15g0699271 [Helianthus annuus]